MLVPMNISILKIPHVNAKIQTDRQFLKNVENVSDIGLYFYTYCKKFRLCFLRTRALYTLSVDCKAAPPPPRLPAVG